MAVPEMPQKFYEVNLLKARLLDKEILNHVDYNQEKKRMPYCFLGDFPFCLVQLPSLHDKDLRFRNLFMSTVCDTDMKNDLEREGIINWCSAAIDLHPVKVKSDGNCLIHALCMAVWGMEDLNLNVRRLMAITVMSDPRKVFYTRWRNYQKINDHEMFNRPSLHSISMDEEWEREWSRVVQDARADTTTNIAVMPYRHLEAIHVFILANIFKRPIIILAKNTVQTYSGSDIQDNNLAGIYLPLERNPDECSSCPIILGFSLSHFCPLLGQKSDASNKKDYLPLVTRSGVSLQVRFLVNERRPDEVLKKYLELKEFSSSESSHVGALIKYKTLSPEFDFLQEYLTEFEQFYTEHHCQREALITTASRQTAATPANRTLETQHASNLFAPTVCKTPGCAFFGNPAQGGMCTKCLSEHLKNEPLLTPATEPSAPPPSMPLNSSEYVNMSSLMGELCQNGCGYRCSVTTFPLCHECSERKQQEKQLKDENETFAGLKQAGGLSQTNYQALTVSQSNSQAAGFSQGAELSQAVGVSQSSSQTAGLSQFNLQATGLSQFNSQAAGFSQSNSQAVGASQSNSQAVGASQSNSQAVGAFQSNFQAAGSSHINSQSVGVTQFNFQAAGNDTTGNAEVNRRPAKSKAMSEIRNSADELFGAGPVTVPTQESCSREKCVIPHCSGTGEPNLGNKCAQCYVENALSRELPPADTQPRRIIKCKEVNCRNAGLQHNDGYCTECAIRLISDPLEEKIICATPGCSGKRMKNTESGLCEKCSDHTRSSPVESVAMPEMERFCDLESRNLIETGSSLSSSDDKRKCAGPRCNEMVSPSQPLCAKCYHILKMNSPREKQTTEYNIPVQNRSLTVPIVVPGPALPSRAHTEPHGRKCITVGCTKYGDPATGDKCTSCYYKSAQSTPQSSAVEEQMIIGSELKFTQVMSKVENIKKSAKLCKVTFCNNYGNPAKEGFCNSCYPGYLRMKSAGDSRCG